MARMATRGAFKGTQREGSPSEPMTCRSTLASRAELRSAYPPTLGFLVERVTGIDPDRQLGNLTSQRPYTG